MKSVDGRECTWKGEIAFMKIREQQDVIQMPLLRVTDGGPEDFDFSLVKLDSRYAAPRHTHNWSAIRFVLEGSHNYAPGKEQPSGTVGYYPEGTFYGPQDNSAFLMALLQFGGTSGQGYYSHEQLLRAQEDLAKVGIFKHGAYECVGKDGKTYRRDAVKALLEHLSGQPIVYPPAQYPEPVLMSPEHFPWQPVAGAPGNYVKALGTFSGGAVDIRMVKVEAGARYVQGVKPCRELLFVVEGELVSDMGGLGQHSALYTQEEERAQYDVYKDVTGLLMTLPSFQH